MDDHDKLQQQMSEIGDRYLKRTLGEMPRLRELLQQVRAGTPGSLEEVAHMAHKIHGSGAMFGFDGVSERARQMEVLVAAPRSGDFEQQLEACVDALEEQVGNAAKSRGIE